MKVFVGKFFIVIFSVGKRSCQDRCTDNDAVGKALTKGKLCPKVLQVPHALPSLLGQQQHTLEASKRRDSIFRSSRGDCWPGF